MKFKHFVYLTILSFIVIYVGLGLVYFNWYSQFNQVNSTSITSRIKSTVAEKAVELIGKERFSKAYSLNTPFLSSS